MGREARRSYDLEQVEIVPSRRTRSSQEVSTAWQLDAYPFSIPLVTHPSDAVVSPTSAVRIGQLGGLAVLNAEGLWARHADADGALARIAAAAVDEPSTAVALLQELHAVPIDGSSTAAAAIRASAPSASACRAHNPSALSTARPPSCPMRTALVGDTTASDGWVTSGIENG